MQQTDQQLTFRLNQGDKQAFRQLFDQYYPYLISTVLKLSGDMELARDVSQEVFFTIWKNREKLQITSSLKAYLRRAAVNRMLNHLKAQKYQHTDTGPILDAPLEGETVLQQLEAGDLQRIIQQAIDQLPQRCRMIFLLCRVEGLSHKEISAQMNISPKTVENQMTKALKTLKKAIHPYTTNDLLGSGFFLLVIGDWIVSLV
ncbi:MAG: RNA polymerase sigma-70 factor [Bacteroidota bacterium]